MIMDPPNSLPQAGSLSHCRRWQGCGMSLRGRCVDACVFSLLHRHPWSVLQQPGSTPPEPGLGVELAVRAVSYWEPQVRAVSFKKPHLSLSFLSISSLLSYH